LFKKQWSAWRGILIGIIPGYRIHRYSLAEEVRQLSCEDLIPAHLLSVDLLANLTEDQKDQVIWILTGAETLPERGPETEELYKDIDQARSDLTKAGIDIEKLMAKYKEIQTSTVESLNGPRVRIPGYFLPLELSDTKVTEFLLVQYIGACIHVPPPPPNQIIHVKTTPQKGYNSKNLFEPVRATGIITAKSAVKDLFSTDGNARINIGYSMQAQRIEPYTE
jgi:hypothetical protein